MRSTAGSPIVGNPTGTTVESRGIYRGKSHGASRGKSHGGKSRGIPRDARWEHEGHMGPRGIPREQAGTHLASRGSQRNSHGIPWDAAGGSCGHPMIHPREPAGFHGSSYGIPPRNTKMCIQRLFYRLPPCAYGEEDKELNDRQGRLPLATFFNRHYAYTHTMNIRLTPKETNLNSNWPRKIQPLFSLAMDRGTPGCFWHKKCFPTDTRIRTRYVRMVSYIGKGCIHIHYPRTNAGQFFGRHGRTTAQQVALTRHVAHNSPCSNSPKEGRSANRDKISIHDGIVKYLVVQ